MTKDLFFDTDCLSAFLWTDASDILEALYDGRIILPDQVYLELSNPRVPHLKKRADALIAKNAASIQEIYTGSDEFRLYRTLIKGDKAIKAIGKGEAAAIALASIYDGVLSSNNYRDITPYIKKYKLQHIDTGQILKEALDKQIITEEKGNILWKRMLDRNRMLPTDNFTAYLSSLKYKQSLLKIQ